MLLIISNFTLYTRLSSPKYPRVLSLYYRERHFACDMCDHMAHSLLMIHTAHAIHKYSKAYLVSRAILIIHKTQLKYNCIFNFFFPVYLIMRENIFFPSLLINFARTLRSMRPDKAVRSFKCTSITLALYSYRTRVICIK